MKKSEQTPDRNKQILLLLLAGVFLMGSLAYASVPLYTLFCRATGFGGTPQRVTEASVKTQDRIVTVNFDGNVDSSLPWDFTPEQRSVRVHLGETVVAAYRAHNRSDKTMTGTATYNVQPDKAGPYFDKVQCFCFTKQTLKPGETAELQVRFYVDPAMAEERRADDIDTITLSYTFYLAKDEGKKESLKQARTKSDEPVTP